MWTIYVVFSFFFDFVESILQIIIEFFVQFFNHICFYCSLIGENFSIDIAWIFLFSYYIIKFWLSVFRVVALIMSMLAIADHVYEYIFFKLSTVFYGSLTCKYDVFYTISIHMEYRTIEHRCYSGTII